MFSDLAIVTNLMSIIPKGGIEMFKYVIAAMIAATPALAQTGPNCASTKDVYEILDQRFDESRTFVGVAQNGLIEIFSNHATNTWTMIATTPNGVSCIIAEGKGFETIPYGDPA